MMSERRPDLPDFARPPVIEVALSIQFERLNELRISHFGLLWTKFRERYSVTQDHPPLASVIEQFDQKRSPPQKQVSFSLSPQDVRVWFLSDDGSDVVQVQRERFTRNWRGEGADYPRYEPMRTNFADDYRKFEEFLAEEKLGALKTSQAEITYVNHIFGEGVWTEHSEAAKVFEVCALPQSPEPSPEDFGFNLGYIIPDGNGRSVGRLHVTIRSAYHTKTQKPLFVMRLTARGLAGSGLEGVLEFMNLGREYIAKRFLALTTGQMHEAWGGRDVF